MQTDRCARSIAILLFAVSLLAGGARLVSAQQSSDATGLSAQAVATLRGLENAGNLPTTQWYSHAADIPHGEAVGLDMSGWTKLKGAGPSTREAVWYRTTITVPPAAHGYDLTHAALRFHLRVVNDGPSQQIIYVNGNRIAMGEDLEPVVIAEDIHPGEVLVLAVKALASSAEKVFHRPDFTIVWPGGRPDPLALHQEILADAILMGKDSGRAHAVVEQAIGDIDLAALKEGNQQAFDASLRKADETLLALKPLLPATTVHLTGNAHIDAAWLWPWTESVDVTRRTFFTALQLMQEYPNYTFSQSAAAYSEWINQKYPDMSDQIRQRIQQGRWEIVGGMWVEPDLNMPDGESQVRQLLVGTRFFRKTYGVETRVGWNPDSFGYNWQLPQIYKRSGIDYFVTQKLGWNDTNKLPLKLFWWEAPDGSRVLTYFPHDYVNRIEPVRLAQDLVKARELNPGLTSMMHLYGIGDHGGGPTRAMLDDAAHWMSPSVAFSSMKFGTAQSYFSSIEGKLDTAHSPTWNYDTLARGAATLPSPPPGQISLPVWKDELYLETHRGTYTTQAMHKRNMRQSEEWMLNAEKYASLAWLDGIPYPGTALEEAWEKVLFNQFHDLAAGSGIHDIYDDAQKDYDAVHATTRAISEKSLSTIAAHVDTATQPGVPILVMNPLAWQRTAVVRVKVQMPDGNGAGIVVNDASGHPLPVQVMGADVSTHTFDLLVRVAGIPSMGYTVLHASYGKRNVPTDLVASAHVLENAKLRVELDPATGCITHLVRKEDGFDYIAAGACGNELVAFPDNPKNYDAWNIDAGFDKQSTPLTHVDSVQLVEKGPLRAAIRIERSWHQSHFRQDIVLVSGADSVDVENDVDWHETHVLLKAAMPLAASSGKATFEIPYGSIQRPTTRNNSWEDARFEVPAIRWADLGDLNHGLALINESKYGYDAKGNLLRLSLLRSPVWPDPIADRGNHRFRYSLYPHSGSWQQANVVRKGYEFNYLVRAMQVQAHTGSLPPSRSFVSTEPNNVVLTAMKRSEDGKSLVLRYYEWAGKEAQVHVHFPDGAVSATAANLMEVPEGKPLPVSDGNSTTLTIHPFEIQTVRIDYGARASEMQQEAKKTWR